MQSLASGHEQHCHYSLFNMRDLLLLLVIRLHLVHLVFLFGLDVCGVITCIVDQLLLHGKVHDVGTDGIEEILRVGSDDENVIIGGKIGLEPDDGAEIEMVRGFIQKEKVWFDKEGPSESYTHPPTTGHILGRLLHHFLTETKTMEDTPGFSFESAGIKLLELFVSCVESSFVNVVGHRKFFNSSLEFGDFFPCRSDNEIYGIDF